MEFLNPKRLHHERYETAKKFCQEDRGYVPLSGPHIIARQQAEIVRAALVWRIEQESGLAALPEMNPDARMIRAHFRAILGKEARGSWWKELQDSPERLKKLIRLLTYHVRQMMPHEERVEQMDLLEFGLVSGG